MGKIRQVWAYNFAYEISHLDHVLQSHNILSIATEFPGFIRQTRWDSIDEQLYADFQSNINQTKLIQMGLTAMDESGNIGDSWEFNFETETADNPSSITFLNDHGLDFDRLKQERISTSVFARSFLPVIRKNGIHRWVTFHGLYDIGYLVKAMGVVEELPETMGEFAKIVVKEVGIVRDLKHMMKSRLLCKGLDDDDDDEKCLGLETSKHNNVGSYSLMMAMLHEKILSQCSFDFDTQLCNGFLYGFSHRLDDLMMTIKTNNLHHLDWFFTKFHLMGSIVRIDRDIS